MRRIKTQLLHLVGLISLLYPAVLLMYLISAAVILLAFLALIVQVPLPYNTTRRTTVLYNFILVYFDKFLEINTECVRSVESERRRGPECLGAGRIEFLNHCR